MHDAQASAGISHPGIVKVYEVGETEDGQPFLAMEHVSGPSLADEIKQNHISTEEAVAIAVQIAEAMQLAVQDMVDFLVQDKGMAPYDAYSLLSLAGDVRMSRTLREISPVKMMLSRDILDQLG